MSYSRQETETIIRRCDDEQFWDIYSACPRDVRRIRRMVEGFDGEIQELGNGAIRAKVPIRAITFRSVRSGNTNPFQKKDSQS